MSEVKFKPGKNIVMKVATHAFEQTEKFYKEIIGLPLIYKETNSYVFLNLEL